ncbi:hypothetical protein cypCar_00041666 [Cyprinus carpio]|nr:hypothetical protein cypCar_00041666 [Cyprinus carpio]
MASAHGRLSQHVLAVLDVVLRVPSIFIIDAIFNSYSEPGTGWTGTAGRALIRALGVLVSSVVLVLSQKSLFKFYTLFVAVLLGAASVLINYYGTSHIDFYSAYNRAALGFGLLPRSGATLWLGLALLQLLLGLGYVALLNVQSLCAALLVLDIMAPLWGLMLELPAHVRQALALASGAILAAHAAVNLLWKLKWFYYSCRYVYLLLRHMYRIYGLQLLLEDTWKRIRFPDILRVFWLTRMTAQAIILVYVVRVVRSESGLQLGWDLFWDLTSNLIISGCDSTLTVLGMSAVISSLAHYLGLSILAFIGSTEEEDKRLGFVAPVLFFILALQTGLSGLEPEERLIRLSRNMCLLLTAILHFIHGMTDPVLMSLSASHVSSVRRHVPVLLVSLALFALPILLSYVLWHHYVLNTWLFAEFTASARITPCHHYFHALCLRKWLYIQDTCPMCHQRVYIEDDGNEHATFSNNNGYAAQGQERAEFEEDEGGANADMAVGGAEPENELLEDNDSIEYDEEEWGTHPGATLVEEEYINDDTDSN